FFERNNPKKLSSKWNKLDHIDIINEYPILSEDNIVENITLGVFQLKRPRSYPAEKATTTDLNGAVNYGIYRYNDYPNIIRVPTKSAHVNRLTRNPIIQFTSDEVLEWWCDCAIGNGLLGCYSHVASAIWFLSFQRWQLNSRNMPSRNFINYVTDAP
ncbi:unnamed protein product, partial [Rotaria socialis]